MKTLDELIRETEAEAKSDTGFFRVCLHAALYRDHIAFLEEQRAEAEEGCLERRERESRERREVAADERAEQLVKDRERAVA